MKKANMEVALAVVVHEGRLLVGRRGEGTHLAGARELPGGKLLPDETPEAASIRELLEETGLSASAEGVMHVQEHAYSDRRVRLHFIQCRLTENNPTPDPPFEWLPLEKIVPGDFPPANREFFETCLGEWQ